MVRESICLYDADPLYGRMIMQALREEGVIPGNYVCFTDIIELCEHVKQLKVALIMLEAGKEEEFFQYLQEKIEEEQLKVLRERILLLTEEQENKPGCLYKYLSRGAMIGTLRQWWESHKPVNAPKQITVIPKVEGHSIRGFISFDSTDVENYFAASMARGNLLGSLVIHMELLPYLQSHVKPPKNLSDLIYQTSINRLPETGLDEYVYTVDGVTYMEPLAHYKDSYEMNDKVAEGLMAYLRTLSYTTIYLITDCHYRGAVTMLELCDTVQLGASISPINRSREEVFLQMLEMEQREELLGKLRTQVEEVGYGSRGSV